MRYTRNVTMRYTRNIKTTNRRKRVWLIIVPVIAALLASGGAGVYWWRHFHKKSAASPTISINNQGTATANPNVPNSASNPVTPSTGSSSAKGDDNTGASSSPLSPTVQPETPSGQFVSYHNPNLSGSPGPNTETSTCNTTPGATCQIFFTKNGVTKSLPAEKADASGTAFWDNWTLQSIDLTAGTWHISAVASNGSKTAMADDQIPFVVGS